MPRKNCVVTPVAILRFRIDARPAYTAAPQAGWQARRLVGSRSIAPVVAYPEDVP